MARNPFPAATPPTWPICGETVRMRWSSERYDGTCTRKPGHAGRCDDGVGYPPPEDDLPADAAVTAESEHDGRTVMISAPPGTDPGLVADMARELARNAHLMDLEAS